MCISGLTPFKICNLTYRGESIYSNRNLCDCHRYCAFMHRLAYSLCWSVLCSMLRPAEIPCYTADLKVAIEFKVCKRLRGYLTLLPSYGSEANMPQSKAMSSLMPLQRQLLVQAPPLCIEDIYILLSSPLVRMCSPMRYSKPHHFHSCSVFYMVGYCFSSCTVKSL